MSETTKPAASADSPVHQRKVTWAAVVSAALGFLALAPDLAHTLLPFIPDPYRERVLAGAAGAAMIAGTLLGRTATANLANTVLPRLQQVEEAPLVTAIPVSSDVAQQVADQLGVGKDLHT